MANEAVIVERWSHPSDFTIADGTAIAKGALLKLTTPRTAIISSAVGDMLAGIAAREKVANDGRTNLAVYQNGIFRMYVSGGALAGNYVGAADTATYPNYVAVVVSGGTMSASGGQILGKILENVTAGASKTALVEVNLA